MNMYRILQVTNFLVLFMHLCVTHCVLSSSLVDISSFVLVAYIMNHLLVAFLYNCIKPMQKHFSPSSVNSDVFSVMHDIYSRDS